jgi:hypothetical protein
MALADKLIFDNNQLLSSRHIGGGGGGPEFIKQKNAVNEKNKVLTWMN